MENHAIKVLLVEDNPAQARLLREILAEVTSTRFELTHVERLGEAMQRLNAERFDVVLLDLGLPDSQGLETFVRLHSHAPYIATVVLTGLDDETLAMNAMQEGAQDYLVKGQEVDRNVLVRSIRYAIERQRVSHYRALLMEQERFNTAIERMSDGIVVADDNWRITNANRAACRLLNLSEDGWEGVSLDAALQPFTLSMPGDGVPLDAHALRSSKERTTPLDVARANTQPPLFLDARLTRLFDRASNLASVVLTLRDVTAERHAHHVRANFFMLVSHKLRTPLTVLGGFLDLCKRLPPERVIEQHDRLLDVCQEEVRRLEEMVQKLLEFKALTTQQLEAEAEQTDVAPIVSTLIEELRQRFSTKPIEMTTDIAPDATHVNASAAHVRFVLDKLLDNAAKFGDKNPVRIHVKVERKGPSSLRFAVSDNGPGIPHEYYDRVFEGFVQVEDRMTGQVPGLGVGLFMARQVVQAYGGSISIQSRIGEGSAVSFTLPAVPPTDSGEAEVLD